MIDTVALREKVLDLAIRGKLVPQDPNDEPASVLLERIRAQKQQMVKDGKLKAKDIKDDSIIFVGEDNLHYEKFADETVECIEDQIPFELPSGWAWSKINNIAFVTKLAGFEYSKYIAPTLCEDGIPLFKGKNVQDSKIIYEFESFIPESISNELSRSQITRKCILTPYVGTIGNIGIHDKVGKFHLGSNVGKIELYNSCVILMEEYVVTYLKSSFGYKQLTKHMKATAQASISIEAIRDVYIPIPPENEQQRMWSAISESLTLIENIESYEGDIANMVKLAKTKILDLAIRGKLVPQNLDDEPASALLERIRSEKEELIKQGKIKRDKKESVIFKGEDNSYYEKFDDGEIKCIDEDVPFELPESWCWCRLGTLFAHNTGKALNSSDSAGTLMTYITTSNLYWDRFELDSLKEMPFTDSEIEKCTVTKGDLLVCEGGDIGRSAIWMHNEDIRIQNHIHRLRPYISLSNRFYYYVLFMWKQTGRIGGQGIGLQGFSSKALHNLIVPLPPLSEQQHIVAYVDELNQKLSDIEKSLSRGSFLLKRLSQTNH